MPTIQQLVRKGREVIVEKSKSPALDNCPQRRLSAVRELARKPVTFEINTGAISRGYRTSPYPAPFILDELQALSAPLIITPDTHSKDSILCSMDKTAKELDRRGCPYLRTMEEVLNISRKK